MQSTASSVISTVWLFRDPYRIQTSKTRLEVREDPVAGTYVPNLLYVDVQSCKQVLQLLAAGRLSSLQIETLRLHNLSI